jgi:hypothetical protein
VPWSNIRIALRHDDGVYVKLCNINTGDSWWTAQPAIFRATSGTCTGAGEHSVEIGYFEGGGYAKLIFLVDPDGGNEAYVPTIDGAWRCPNFDWSRGRCSGSWSFVVASQSVPHFRGTNYTPSTTNDGGGTPQP